MSDHSTSWFHCGHCGSLFQAPVGRNVQRACSSCGLDPTLGVKPISVAEKQSHSKDATSEVIEEHKPRGERHKKRRRSKKSAPMLLLIVGWSVVMAGIVLIANRCWKNPDNRDAASFSGRSNGLLSDAEIEMLNRHVGAAEVIVRSVVTNTAPESISPFVLNAPSTFADIARFYPMNPGLQMFEPNLQREDLFIIRLPEGPAIEGRWRNEDGRLIEAVFRLENEELRLDWHHFVRYSDFPWSLFLSGDGPDQGQFRLLARQRLTRMVLDDTSARPLSVEFFAPRFGNPDDLGPASPPFDLDRDSDVAKKMMAAFEQARKGHRPFESILPPMESDDEVIRVRVTVRRIQTAEDRRFELVDLHACHWLQHEDSGIKTLPPEE